MNNIRLFLTDIDGVWTDGGMYYDEKGNEYKKFNTSDSAGILFCRLISIHTGIITGENSMAVKKRAEKLKIEHCFLGIKDKVSIAEKLLEELRLNWNEVAYVGDDINDIELLKKVGLSASPVSASEYVKELVDWVIPVKGGDGVFRHFVEKYLKEQNLLEKVLAKYLKSKEFKQ
ncbi:MAG: HAD hydrolase family protein [Flavobacteriaceae bacterium]|nr:MAG: HAD hydrolase family protein [Flavobacteriaceae bacterium]